MKHAVAGARKVDKGRLAQHVGRGRKPFHGARGAKGPKDPKDLRGAKGLLVRDAQDMAADEERYAATGPTGPGRSAPTTRRRSMLL